MKTHAVANLPREAVAVLVLLAFDEVVALGRRVLLLLLGEDVPRTAVKLAAASEEPEPRDDQDATRDDRGVCGRGKVELMSIDRWILTCPEQGCEERTVHRALRDGHDRREREQDDDE